mmetsp:Transcript_88906/g.177795  ORF Transcript_88906/g.177795 Transcript_88906/m.177795 type:complete len:315 (-) Transcript_88906:174-1118(-)
MKCILNGPGNVPHLAANGQPAVEPRVGDPLSELLGLAEPLFKLFATAATTAIAREVVKEDAANSTHLSSGGEQKVGVATPLQVRVQRRRRGKRSAGAAAAAASRRGTALELRRRSGRHTKAACLVLVAHGSVGSVELDAVLVEEVGRRQVRAAPKPPRRRRRRRRRKRRCRRRCCQGRIRGENGSHLTLLFCSFVAAAFHLKIPYVCAERGYQRAPRVKHERERCSAVLLPCLVGLPAPPAHRAGPVLGELSVHYRHGGRAFLHQIPILKARGKTKGPISVALPRVAGEGSTASVFFFDGLQNLRLFVQEKVGK